MGVLLRIETHAQREAHVTIGGEGNNLQSKDSSEDTSLVNTLILDFWLPELQENTFPLFKPPSLWHFSMAALATLIQLSITQKKLQSA